MKKKWKKNMRGDKKNNKREIKKKWKVEEHKIRIKEKIQNNK